MMAMNSFPALTTTYANIRDFIPEPGSVYLSGLSVETRSEHRASWESKCVDVNFCSIEAESYDEMQLSFGDSPSQTISLRSGRHLSRVWREIGIDDIYLDITGLRHSTWAALLRGVIGLAPNRLRVVYVEPESYRMSSRPTQNEIYDLSEKTDGIRPLPGFARLRRDSSQNVFSPLLGFEGARLLYLMNQLEPAGQMVFPIVGIPGFRPEYPFVTYWANRTALRESQAWKKAIFAPASCPFATLNAINNLRDSNAGMNVTLAPIGTKPQALAAVVAALTEPRTFELVYDHPVRKAKRTSGTSRLHVYELTGLLS